ncbi:MAG: molybdate ABC transporter substrate-binding protein [Planctomycetota bacterium]
MVEGGEAQVGGRRAPAVCSPVGELQVSNATTRLCPASLLPPPPASGISRFALTVLILASLGCGGSPSGGSAPLTVFAAASSAPALERIAAAFEEESAIPVRASYASSATLAAQIERGAPAALFLSADSRWMDRLEEGGHLLAGTRLDLLGNELVIALPRTARLEIVIERGFDIAAAFEGRWVTGDPASVPLGARAREALKHLGWWPGLKGRLVGALDARAALAILERGECALGVLYHSDAEGSGRVQVAGGFPGGSHAPIRYPVAILNGAPGEPARRFLAFLRSAAARSIFEEHGFEVLAEAPAAEKAR